MKSHDPDKVPELDEEAFAEADRLGLHPVYIICDEPGAKRGDASGVSFVCFSYFTPRVGERLDLEDGTKCEVKRVYYVLTRTAGSKIVALTPNVYATRLGDPK